MKSENVWMGMVSYALALCVASTTLSHQICDEDVCFQTSLLQH